MAGFINVEADVEEVQRALEKTSKSVKSIGSSALRVIARGSVSVIKGAIRTSGLQKRSGELLKCYGYKVAKNGKTVNVYPKAINNPDVSIFPKIGALSYGTDKRPNRHLKAFGFVQAGIKAAESGAYQSEMQKMIDKELQKYWG